MASLPENKTKIVATIGPASDRPEMLEKLIVAGMNVARLNFSHGTFAAHAETAARVRSAASRVGKRVAIMADLPGPKMRLGQIDPEPVSLTAGDRIALTSEDVIGTAQRISMTFEQLPAVVRAGHKLFLNDGLVQLRVDHIAGNDVHCIVEVGGELRSRKGLNLPDIDLGMSAFTDRDRAGLDAALDMGVDAVSQSFVERAADIEALRAATMRRQKCPFVIAKIERSGALKHLDEILAVSDGLMVARGDLGVEVPIEEIALTQKRLISMANRAGKPVIVATQMLESMQSSRLPTRAEATDVANAILDGCDCVMLSGESAMGKFPEESVHMLARIAAYTERHRPVPLPLLEPLNSTVLSPGDRMALVLEQALRTVPNDAVIVPTKSGTTARLISRSKPTVWIIVPTADPAVAQHLTFSYGVIAVEHPDEQDDWSQFAREFLTAHGLPAERALLVAGPSIKNPLANHRVEMLRLSDSVARPV